jgi:hypothetical protein
VSGNGKIGELHYRLLSSVAPGTPVIFSVGSAVKIDANGINSPLTTGSVVTNAVSNPVGMGKLAQDIRVSMFPNPASSELTVLSSAESTHYTITDVTGRSVLAGEFTGSAKIDISALSEGVYMAEFSSSQGHNIQKLVVDHK